MAVRVVGTNVTGQMECSTNGCIIIRLPEGSRALGQDGYLTVPADEVEYVGKSEDEEMARVERDCIADARRRLAEVRRGGREEQ